MDDSLKTLRKGILGAESCVGIYILDKSVRQRHSAEQNHFYFRPSALQSSSLALQRSHNFTRQQNKKAHAILQENMYSGPTIFKSSDEWKHEKLLQTKIQEYLGKALFEICCFQRLKLFGQCPYRTNTFQEGASPNWWFWFNLSKNCLKTTDPRVEFIIPK